MFRARYSLARLNPFQARRFSDNTTKPPIGSSSSNNNAGSDKTTEPNAVSKYEETYKQLGNLDFATAAKILFSDPPRKKKFGFDFHLVQFFFACLPSLAVYLVAQYARSEMRRMDAELEQKRKKEEEEKAKEMEQKAIEERERSHPEILEVKVRLDKLEEAVKEIVVESKKQPSGGVTKNQEDDGEKKYVASRADVKISSSSESSKSVDSEQKSVKEGPGFDLGKLTGSASIPDASQPNQKGKTENSKDAKR